MESTCPVTGWNLQEAFDALLPDHLKTELRAVKKALADARTKNLLTPSVLAGGNLDEKAEARDWLKRVEASLISTERDLEHYLEEKMNTGVCHARGRIASVMADHTDIVSRSWSNIRVFLRGHNEAFVACDAMIIEVDKQTPIYDLRIFDVPPGAAEARARHSRTMAASCFQWLREEMEMSPRKKPQPKSAYWEDAQKLFPQLSNVSFKNQWDLACKAVPNCNWDNAGRPRKSNNENQQSNKIEDAITDLTAPPS